MKNFKLNVILATIAVLMIGAPIYGTVELIRYSNASTCKHHSDGHVYNPKGGVLWCENHKPHYFGK